MSLRHPTTARAAPASDWRRPEQADVLADALPWLKRFHGQIVVVKYGGNAMTDDDAASRPSPRTSCSCGTPA